MMASGPENRLGWMLVCSFVGKFCKFAMCKLAAILATNMDILKLGQKRVNYDVDSMVQGQMSGPPKVGQSQ